MPVSDTEGGGGSTANDDALRDPSEILGRQYRRKNTLEDPSAVLGRQYRKDHPKPKPEGEPFGGAEPFVLNPPFDPRMRRIGSPTINPVKMKRGWIETSPDWDTNYRVNFMFNPSEVNLSHSISWDIPDTSLQAANPNQPAGVTGVPAALGTSLGISLLFDRTYDVWTKADTLAHTFGVFADVGAFYKYLGIIGDMPTTTGPTHMGIAGEEDNPELDNALGWEFFSPTSPPFMVLSYLFIGTYMKYYGYIDSFSVVYTHWSASMVPIRARVDIGYTLLMDPAVSESLQDPENPGDVRRAHRARRRRRVREFVENYDPFEQKSKVGEPAPPGYGSSTGVVPGI